MAVTHDDLAPSPKNSDLGSKTGAFLMIVSILLGLICFILCLISEATRSEMTWDDEGKGMKSQCIYTGSGKLPLFSSSGAFVALGMAMVVQHTYLLIALSKSDALLEISWDTDSAFSKSLSWQAGFFFVATWVTFAVGEILLLIGLSVESGHLKNWSMPRPTCLIIPKGLFTSAGAFGLVTAFLASGLYITALRAERHFEEREITRREMMETSVMYASPPTSPVLGRITITTLPNEMNPNLPRHGHRNFHTLYDYLTAFDKQSSLV